MSRLLSAVLLAASANAAAGTVPPEAADLPAGVHIHLEREVDASAEEAWRVLAHEYVDVAVWSTSTAESWEMTAADVPEGYTPDPDAPVIGRVLTSAKFGEITETLVMYDEEGRSFRFAGGGLPKIMPYAGNTQSVVDLGDGRSKIVFDIYFVPKGPAKLMKGKIKKVFERGLGRSLDEAATYIETGTPAVPAS